jgi:DNA repair exonuclease SbcCD nuclease subunit
MVKILASADLHLGMKFAGYPGVQDKLSDARFLTLRRLVDMANQMECDLFIVAGDLFDRVSVSTKDVKRAADSINDFQGQLAAILPGNHDFYSAGSLWSRFAEAAGDRVLVLHDPQVYDLRHYDLEVLLYAAPCDSKHGKAGTVSRLNQERPAPSAAGGQLLRIGVAHGSLEGISPDAQGIYFPMKRAELDALPVHLWIIGHTHRQQMAAGDTPVLIPGTPEPDGFDCSHAGSAWLIEADPAGTLQTRSLETGLYRFVREEHVLEGAPDLRPLSGKLKGLEPERTLLRLKLSGRLDREELADLRALISEEQASFAYTSVDDSALFERISEQTVEAQFTQGSFPYRLLKELIRERDFEALQTAYSLLREQNS